MAVYAGSIKIEVLHGKRYGDTRCGSNEVVFANWPNIGVLAKSDCAKTRFPPLPYRSNDTTRSRITEFFNVDVSSLTASSCKRSSGQVS